MAEIGIAWEQMEVGVDVVRMFGPCQYSVLSCAHCGSFWICLFMHAYVWMREYYFIIILCDDSLIPRLCVEPSCFVTSGVVGMSI